MGILPCSSWKRTTSYPEGHGEGLVVALRGSGLVQVTWRLAMDHTFRAASA